MNDPVNNDILNFIGPIFNDLTEQQKERLDKISREIKNPQNMNIDQALKILNEVGIDPNEMRKKINLQKAEKVKNRLKIGLNEKCHCGSDKKYKKCCYLSLNN